MKIDKFKTREEDGKLYVYVEVPPAWKLANIPKITLNTQDICAMLDERGIKHGKCLHSEELKNWRERTRKKEWIFEIFVDKVEKPVILKEEKSVQPKPKRQRRTRSSTKKVSTEE
jgi:hypothetical protein